MQTHTIAALAGRPIDAPDAETARFPLGNVARVRERIAAVLREHHVAALVASAECGAGLIGLDAAAALGLRRRIVLPFPVAEFRQKSVTDRPGDWETIYDEVLQNSNVEVHEVPAGQEGYLEVNRRLLDKAQALAAELGTSVAALVIWNLKSRGDDDVTAHFLHEARERNLPVSEISTL